MVTKNDYQNEILSFIAEYHNLCQACGDCCQKLAIPLHPFELPLIARMFKDANILRRHIQRNPYPFNTLSEYFFKIDSGCPFLKSTKCSIYSNRPLGCRLFPVHLMAFLDDTRNRFREPLFKIESGESQFPCIMDNILTNERFMLRVKDMGKPAEKIIDYVVAAVIDDLNFIYLFGQEPEKSSASFHPNLNEIQSMGEFSKEFLDTLFKLYQDPTIYSIEVWQRLIHLSDEEVDEILSRRHLLRISKIANQLLNKMQKHRHPLLEWRKYIRG